jgi:hypothetical protein
MRYGLIAPASAAIPSEKRRFVLEFFPATPTITHITAALAAALFFHWNDECANLISKF